MSNQTQAIIALIISGILLIYMWINWDEDEFTDDDFGM